MKVEQVGSLLDDIRYGFTGSAIAERNGIGFIRVTDIDEYGHVNYSSVPGVDVKAEEAERYFLEQGDCIIARSGTVGKAHVYNGESNKNIFASYLIRLRLNKKKIHPSYFDAFTKSPLYWKQIEKNKQGGVQQNINTDGLSRLEIPLPDLKTQKEIAHVLEQADKARQQRKAANALTDQFLQSCFLSLFGDPVKNEKGWELKKLATLCNKITDGEHTTPKREESGIKLLSARNIKNGYIDFKAGLDFIGQDEFDRISQRCNPEYDDVLMSCSGTVGRVSTVNITEPFSLVRSVALIKPKKNLIVPKYLEFFLRSDYGQYQIDVRANKSSQANIFTGPIKELDIVVPPLSIQQQFASIVAQAEQLRQKQRETERELETLFQALLQKYFG